MIKCIDATRLWLLESGNNAIIGVNSGVMKRILNDYAVTSNLAKRICKLDEYYNKIMRKQFKETK